MFDNSVPIGSFRGVALRKLRAFAGVPALYLTGTGETCTSLEFAIFLINREKDVAK